MKQYKVVGLERRGKLSLAAVLKIKAGKQDVYLETGDKVTVACAKDVWEFSGEIEANDDKTMKLALADLRRKFCEESVDLAMLWECLDDEREYNFRELVENYHGECTHFGAGSVFVALSDDPCYFQLRGGNFIKESKNKVESVLLQGQREKQRRAEEESLIEWIKRGKGAIDRDSEYVDKLLDALKRHALYGEENSTPEGNRMAQLMGIESDDLLILLEERGIFPKDINETMYRNPLPIKFPAKAISESKALIAADSDFNGRRVLSDLWNIAIDDKSTDEVDDAISYHKVDGLDVLGVHIADVSFVIPVGGALDKFATERFATVYFPEEKFPLFPMPLVQSRLTLAVGKPRATVSGFFYFDGSELVRREFELTALVLGRRATYEDTAGEIGQEAPFAKLLQLATYLRDRRVSEGAVITHSFDRKIEVEDGKVAIKIISCNTPGHLAVSESMILFNESVAGYLAKNEVPAFFRVQTEKIEPVEVSPEDPLFSIKIRRGLKGAGMSISPALHRSLGVKSYTQSSSPIRRYGDLIIQRQLVAHLAGEKPSYDKDALANAKMLLARPEKAVRLAENSRLQFWLYKYLKQNKGKIFQAFVSRVLEEQRVMVYIPELLQEFHFKVDRSADAKEGVELYLRLQGASPRKKKAHWARVD